MSEVEVLGPDEFRKLWDDPVYRAERESEAIQRKDSCFSCHEAPCECGEAARLLAEIQNAPVVDLRSKTYQIHHGKDVA